MYYTEDKHQKQSRKNERVLLHYGMRRISLPLRRLAVLFAQLVPDLSF